MSDYDIELIKDIFARLFVLAIHQKTNLSAFTHMFERSKFVRKIEIGTYDVYFNKSIVDIFNEITGISIDEDTSYGIYNDAYWSGFSYYNLFLKTHKSFSYLFLKLPLNKMLDIYSIFHEMDTSSLVKYFFEIANKKTILRLLCEEKNISISKLSNQVEISANTLAKYNASDDALYNGSFMNIMKLVKYFDVPPSLFEKELIYFIL